MEKSKKVRMSPAARKLAKQMGINVGELQSDGIIRSKDILSVQAQHEAYNNEILQDYNNAVMNTNEDLAQRYSDILVLERKNRSAAAWQDLKASQDALLLGYLDECREKAACRKAHERRRSAKSNWQEAAQEQTKAKNAFIDSYYEASAAANRESRMKAAYSSWISMKKAQTESTNAFLQAVEDEKARLRAQERRAAAKASWEALKADSDAKIEAFMQQYEEAQYEKAYTDYVTSLDEFNQVSVGKLEFDAEVIEDAVEESDMSFNDALTRYVASAVAKALVDLECPIYENGVMNIISLTGAKPIKTVTNAHEGEFRDLVYEDAIYFSKDIKVRIWDISVCGLESFFASQGGINVYINIDDDEVDLDVAIDTSVMMDLEALIFLMRMKEYLAGNEEDDEDEEDEE